MKKDSDQVPPAFSQEDFGFERVSLEDKTRKVQEVFSSVSLRYDLMNDLMSLGLHRMWKRFAIDLCRLGPNDCVLDLAGGTGDLTRLIAKKVGKNNVIIADANNEMLT